MIDSHCHLADAAFDQDLPNVIDRARAAGVTMMVCIADSLGEAERCIAIAEEHHLACTVGVHPHHAKDWKAGDDSRISRLVASSSCVKAIGEIGLDYHYDFSPREVQREVFRTQVQLAKELGLPVVVHNRESIGDLRRIVEEEQPEKAVLHCCTEKFEDVRWAIERGYLLSFTGIATYKKADDIRNTIRRTPLRQILIETDAPYLAPQPHRGKRNEPAFVADVAKLLAIVKEVSLQEVDEVTTQNAVEFFGLRS